MQEVMKKIYDYSLEYIMETRFGRYSKAIIQDRALPDARDGLKPVQRRILYSMYREKNTFDKIYRKSAKAVGTVMGNFHPHGDSSIYEAMVRMSQWWKQNVILIDMHGNNGSIDGDGPAAMRYTEARLAKISTELLKDIDKNNEKKNWAWNFDDTELEPTVLPAKFPNLLVNGSTGISAGYATNIPPHNLGEIIDATIKRIEKPNCTLETILEIVKGPDFPTGAIVEGKKGITEAFQTGRGKIIIKSKYTFVKSKGKEQILISEIPFEVNKQQLVKKIDEIRIDKKIEGIIEARDESNREGIQIAIDLKKDANKELILNYLLKNTDLQISYSYNMVAIVNKRPMVLGILELLDAYITHQKEIITKRTEFDLAFAKKRLHIIEGYIRTNSILDDVIKTIRASKNKAGAQKNLQVEYQFTEEQAEAIVLLQLYRLTNFDITEFINEQGNLKRIIQGLEAILSDEEKLKATMKEELKNIKKEYATPRKTEIREEITEIKIDTTEMLPKEDCIVIVTKEGYVKRVSKRSFSEEDPLVKEGDYPIGIYELNTLDTLLLFTDLGNYLYIPVYELPDLKWKELGKHISNLIKISAEEKIIASIPVLNFDTNTMITTCTKLGMIKRTPLKEYKVQRYSKPMCAIKLKENDQVISVTNEIGDEVFLTTKRGYALRYKTEEIPVVGIKAAGVKAITLKEDSVISMNLFSSQLEYVSVFTDKGTGKRVKLTEFEPMSRARKGILLIRDVKTNPYFIQNTFISPSKQIVGIESDVITYLKLTELPILDRYSTGTQLSKKGIKSVFKKEELMKKETLEHPREEKEEKSQINLATVDQKMMTIDDYLNDFKL